MEELHLTKKDFKIEWFSGTGAGGQYRNKHQNCCRITHIESGIMTTGQSHRERPANQKEAFNKLAKILIRRNASEAPRNWFNNVVRTYHYERNTVTDGDVTAPITQVKNGDIDNFIKNGLQGKRKIRKTGRV